MANKIVDLDLNDSINTYKAMSILKKDIPKYDDIAQKCKDIRDEVIDIYNEYREESSKNEKLVKELTKKNDNLLKFESDNADEIVKLNKLAKSNSTEIKNLDKKIEDIQKDFKDLLKITDGLNSRFGKLFEIISEDKSKNQKSKVEWESIDYWDKHFKGSYLLLTRKIYSPENDYCIFVERIENNYARGLFFEKGEVKNKLAKTAIRTDLKDFKLYTGKSYDKIVKYLDNSLN